MQALISVPAKEFNELMIWLERCEEKGHLENCADLIQPFNEFCQVYYNMEQFK